MHFAQVAVAAPTVDWGGNCGNMTAAVGPFAIDSGLVRPVEPITVIRIRSTNTGSIVRAHVPVRDGVVLNHGDFAIAGCPDGGAYRSEWLNPGGSLTGRLLPTGRPVDRLVPPTVARLTRRSMRPTPSSLRRVVLGVTGDMLPSKSRRNRPSCRRWKRSVPSRPKCSAS